MTRRRAFEDRHLTHPPSSLRRLKKLRRCTCGGADEATRAPRVPTGVNDGAGSPRDVPRGGDGNGRVGISASVADLETFARDARTERPTSDARTERDPRFSARPAGRSSPTSSRARDVGDEAAEKNESDADESDENEDGACERCAAAFYAELERQMTAAAKAYFGWTLKILTRAPLGGDKRESAPTEESGARLFRDALRAGFRCSPASRRDQPSVRLGRRFVEASQDAPDLRGLHIDATTEARECLRWAELNTTALRKILKKWDKTNASARGAKALAAYWKRSEYQMLHSPVTMELRAVAGMLREGEDGPVWNTSLRDEKEKSEEEDDDAPPRQRSFGTYPSSSFGSASEMIGSSRGDEGHAEPSRDARFDADAPTCGVCLDTLYKPVGLECGHVFCRDCLLRAAGVLDHRGTSLAVSLRGRETVSRVAAGEAAAEPESWRARDKCPECRLEGVFLTSTRLRHVEACIKRLDPEGHRARRAESKRTWRDATKFAWGNMPKAIADALKQPGGSSAALSLASFVVGVVVAVVAL